VAAFGKSEKAAAVFWLEMIFSGGGEFFGTHHRHQQVILRRLVLMKLTFKNMIGYELS